MSSGTKQAIVASFLHLAAKKTPDKITVRDIVDDCGVNRNTFYYYFQDIYAVIEELCDALLAELPQHDPREAIALFYEHLLHFCHAHPAAARSLAVTLGFEGLERYLGARITPLVTELCRDENGVSPSLSVRMTCHSLLGLCLDAMRGGKIPVHSAEEVRALLNSSTSIPLIERKHYEKT